MLDLERVDLRSLAEALEDHSPETMWWFDPQTGETEPNLADPVSVGLDEEEEDPLDRELIRIEPIPSREAYGDMEDFIERVRDPRTRDLLERAIAGRGAFRRFKDTLLDFQELLRCGLRSTTRVWSAAPSTGWRTRGCWSAASRSGRSWPGRIRSSQSWPPGSIR